MSAQDNICQRTHNAHHSVEKQLGLPNAAPDLVCHCPLFYTSIDVLDRRSLSLQLMAPLLLILELLDLPAHLGFLRGRDDYAHLASLALVAHDEGCG